MAETSSTRNGSKDSPLLTLSTQLKPCAKVEVDGKLYDVLSGEHIDRDNESRLMGLFSENDRYTAKLEKAAKREDAEKAAANLRDTRVEIITTVTTIPENIVSAFGMSVQGQLIEVCAKELGLGSNRQAKADGDSADADAGADE